MTIGVKPLKFPKNQCYDLAFDCDCQTGCPDILLNDCGLFFSNSIRTKIMIVLGSCSYNFLGYQHVDWEKLRKVPLNGFGLRTIRQEIQQAFDSAQLTDFVDLDVTFSKGCFLIKLDILGEEYSLISDNKACFLDVFNTNI